MPQKKLIRFAELKTLPNVLEFPADMSGQWNKFFKNDNPIVLELACGKGEYAVGLAKIYPEKNFIGVDLKGNRIWVGAKKALSENLSNVAFLRTQIDHLSNYFAPNEIQSIWITFPDPQLRKSKAKKRLTHPRFLRIYDNILVDKGKIHLKTDSPDLYIFTKIVIQLYGCKLHSDQQFTSVQNELSPELQIKTHYQSLDIAGSNAIYYLSFTLPARFPGAEKDEELKQILKDERIG